MKIKKLCLSGLISQHLPLSCSQPRPHSPYMYVIRYGRALPPLSLLKSFWMIIDEHKPRCVYRHLNKHKQNVWSMSLAGGTNHSDKDHTRSASYNSCPCTLSSKRINEKRCRPTERYSLELFGPFQAVLYDRQCRVQGLVSLTSRFPFVYVETYTNGNLNDYETKPRTRRCRSYGKLQPGIGQGMSGKSDDCPS